MTELVALGPDDLEALLALEEAQPIPVSMPTTLARALASSRHQVFGAVDEYGRILGYALLAIQAFDGELEAVLVAADARRQGIAGRLLAQVISTARERQLERLLLEVRAGNNAAIVLYRAAGFAQDGIRKGYYPPAPDSVEREDACLMSLDLDSSARNG
ncbi:GNAT family N-acetyltransferase [Halomonas huangheensis]|uniref:GNAT family N-acetyltransferase n=1 Tax=Halomonas huangheensis TaxID=1178482 RepID=UPI0003FC3C12|nr:GNAT family N-acetyltransferase [Halomonas huangheensis]ALM54483.1 hypothetical protein AR456_02560 [Halomonas huangheensis]